MRPIRCCPGWRSRGRGFLRRGQPADCNNVGRDGARSKTCAGARAVRPGARPRKQAALCPTLNSGGARLVQQNGAPGGGHRWRSWAAIAAAVCAMGHRAGPASGCVSSISCGRGSPPQKPLRGALAWFTCPRSSRRRTMNAPSRARFRRAGRLAPGPDPLASFACRTLRCRKRSRQTPELSGYLTSASRSAFYAENPSRITSSPGDGSVPAGRS